jgi:NAD(P)-dependent dehydrogenase (short-subunit alcohol dehydrogenase family)
MNMLTNRTALVTGASRGIGRASAIALAKTGCDVVVNYLHSRDHAEEVAREVSSLGRRSLAIQADVSVEADVKRLIAEAEAQLALSTFWSTTPALIPPSLSRA